MERRGSKSETSTELSRKRKAPQQLVKTTSSVQWLQATTTTTIGEALWSDFQMLNKAKDVKCCGSVLLNACLLEIYAEQFRSSWQNFLNIL